MNQKYIPVQLYSQTSEECETIAYTISCWICLLAWHSELHI